MSRRRVTCASVAVVAAATRLKLERTVKWNVLPLPDSLSTQMLTAHQLDQVRRDREAEAGAAVLARRRAVGLRERLEDCSLAAPAERRCRYPTR